MSEISLCRHKIRKGTRLRIVDHPHFIYAHLTLTVSGTLVDRDWGTIVRRLGLGERPRGGPSRVNKG